jgi:hypothetical protein
MAAQLAASQERLSSVSKIAKKKKKRYLIYVSPL